MWVAASLYEAVGDTQSLTAQYQIALDLCRQTGITYDRAWALMEITQYSFIQGELDQAEAAIREAYAYRAQLGLHGELADNTDLLARIAYCRGESQLAMAHVEEALALVEQSGFTYARASQQPLLGQLYLAQGQSQRALAQFQHAVAGEQPDAKGMPTLIAALADLAAFQAYGRQLQVQKPDLRLQQWWLVPSKPDFRLAIFDFGLSAATSVNLKSKIKNYSVGSTPLAIVGGRRQSKRLSYGRLTGGICG
jgi:tetratricopeptide (TPR) repeat protein